MATDLGDKMRALADTGHPRAAELRTKAKEFDREAEAYDNPKRLLGTWARARKLWCDCTGESLI